MIRAPHWLGLLAGVTMLGIAIGVAANPRRRGLGAARDAEYAPKAIRPELDEAERRARAAGARGELTYIGAGMTGVVFCDEHGQAFKVARKPMQEDRADVSRTVEDEAKWLQAAAKLPGVKRHVARGVRYDRTNHVLVRECVRKSPERDNRVNERRLHALHQRLGAEMLRTYGWGTPEYKPDSYVYTRDRGPVLVDAGFAVRRGRELVRDTLDLLNGRRSLARREKIDTLAWELRMERGDTIPVAVANKLLHRLKAIEPSVEID